LTLAKVLAGSGWNLIIDGRTGETLDRAAAQLATQTTVIAVQGDVSEHDHRRQLALAAETLGGLDLVVNNAGILGLSPQTGLLDYPLDVLAEVYQVNAIAPLGVLQAVRRHLKADARVINITSDAAVEAYSGWGGYGSSKAALEQLSAVLALENPGWRIYWVDPGDMRTQMQQDAFPGEDISDRPLPEAVIPGLLTLLHSELASGHYAAQRLAIPEVTSLRSEPD
jgi:NAD(P)-dependent dehydrogenase (short-subunit alcohol dehydrogenase family)